MSQSTLDLFGTWSATATTKTVITSINTNEVSAIMLAISSVSSVASTETDASKLAYLSVSMRGALASLTVVSGEMYLATATATQNFPEVTDSILQASLNLKNIFDGQNYYKTDLILSANSFFAALFGVVFVAQIALFAWSRSWYYGICFIAATGLEFSGYLIRALSAKGNETNANYIIQTVFLHIAPAFLMAGIYFMLAQMMVVTGPKSSIMKPLWFSYIFIGCDFLSIVLQGNGGGVSNSKPKVGRDMVLAGIIFQLLTMSAFIYFLIDFYLRSFFAFPLSAERKFKSFLHMFFATKNGRGYGKELERSYDPEFAEQRAHSPFLYSKLPLVMFTGVILVYIRCVYRVAELLQGFDGRLHKTETYLLFMDGLLIFITCALFLVWHVAVIFGKKGVMSAKMLRLHARALKEQKAKDMESGSEFEVATEMDQITVPAMPDK